MTDTLNNLAATDLVRGLAAGTFRTTDLMAACLARIDAREADVQAFAWLDRNGALAAAEAADQRRRSGDVLGPLHGLPVAVKDIIDTADMPTEFGTPIHKGRRPDRDATIVARLKAAGAIIIGKTVTSEHAVYAAGPTRNPHALDRTPGGSSSGSAAAVADFMVPVALSTQTNGSTIRPASFCGVVGYKPSLGLLPRTGVLKQSTLLDHPGVMARSVADAALIVEVIGGADNLDEMSFGTVAAGLRSASDGNGSPPRLAFVRSPSWPLAEPETQRLIEGFVAGLGLSIEPIQLPPAFDRAIEALVTIMSAAMAQSYSWDFASGRALMADVLVGIIERGQAMSATALLEACALRDELRDSFNRIIAPYDAALTPAARGVAPLFAGIGGPTGDPVFASLWTLIGVPAISLPLLTDPYGLPIGVQLVSGTRRDAMLLRAAASVERMAAAR